MVEPALFESIQRPEDRAGLSAFEAVRGGIRHIGVNALAGEVIPIGKLLIHRRGTELPPHPHPVAVCPIFSAREVSEEFALHWDRFVTSRSDLLDRNHRLDMRIAHIRRADDHANYLDRIGLVVVPGEGLRAEIQLDDLVPKGTQRETEQAKEGQQQHRK